MKARRSGSNLSNGAAPDGRTLRKAYGRELRHVLRQAARHPDSDTVHEVRKGVTRLRSWLRLMRSDIGLHRYRGHNRLLRRAMDALAPVRDAHVVRVALEALGGPARFPELWRHLRKQERRATRSAAGAMREARRRLRKELDVAVRLPIRSVAGADLSAALERMRDETCSAFADAKISGGTEQLHRWRRRTKNYLHALGFLAGEGDRRYRAAVRVSRLLGQEHDLSLLEHVVSARGEHAENPVLLKLIQQRRARLRRQYFSLKPGPFPG